MYKYSGFDTVKDLLIPSKGCQIRVYLFDSPLISI